MNKYDVVKLIAKYIVGIKDGIPSSHLWMLIDPQMVDVEKHQKVLRVLTDAGLVKVQAHYVTLTPKGKVMLDRIVNEVLANH